jgi:hypothetical protein
MEGIAYALGNDAHLPVEVRTNCDNVTLEIVSRRGESFRLTRATERCYPVLVEGSDFPDLVLETAAEWSKWWLDATGIPERTLTDKSQKPTLPYVSTLLPFFWVDQDTGWMYSYSPPDDQKFILGQEEELKRLLLGVPPRRVFRDVGEYRSAKRSVQALVEQVETRKRLLENLRREADLAHGTTDKLEADRNGLVARLGNLQSAADAVHAGTNEFQPAIDEVRSKRAELRRRTAHLREQKHLLEDAAAEIEADSEMLSRNVVAHETFRQFCGHENCKLFAATEASSYGRRLLYLGDQLKDLRVYAEGLEDEIAHSESESS